MHAPRPSARSRVVLTARPARFLLGDACLWCQMLGTALSSVGPVILKGASPHRLQLRFFCFVLFFFSLSSNLPELTFLPASS